jgi:hypothetical protein
MSQGSVWYPPLGSYVVVNTRGLGAAVIRKFTHSWADHAVIVTDDVGGIVEAMPSGVRRGHLAEYAGRRTAVCTEGALSQREQVAAAAVGMVGTPYDDLDLVDIGLECIGINWGWLQQLVEKQHSLICSQAVSKCGQIAGLDWSCGQMDLAQVTPAMLARRIQVAR